MYDLQHCVMARVAIFISPPVHAEHVIYSIALLLRWRRRSVPQSSRCRQTWRSRPSRCSGRFQSTCGRASEMSVRLQRAGPSIRCKQVRRNLEPVSRCETCIRRCDASTLVALLRQLTGGMPLARPGTGDDHNNISRLSRVSPRSCRQAWVSVSRLSFCHDLCRCMQDGCPGCLPRPARQI